ncbi:MAG: S1 RNA-binding domain-containing protein [Opitutales bacterium]|nr:S1 RNA-binding domain-containing protein [Opitutales bacterium]
MLISCDDGVGKGSGTSVPGFNLFEAMKSCGDIFTNYGGHELAAGFTISPDKVGALIGPGGKNIRRITEVSGAQIDIDDDNPGKVLIFANSATSMNRAVSEVELIAAEIEVGKTYRGIVRSIKEFGAFVECLPGKEGLVHISELADFRVKKTEDVCKLGDEMIVKCIGIDDKGKVRLSRKAALEDMKQA